MVDEIDQITRANEAAVGRYNPSGARSTPHDAARARRAWGVFWGGGFESGGRVLFQTVFLASIMPDDVPVSMSQKRMTESIDDA